MQQQDKLKYLKIALLCIRCDFHRRRTGHDDVDLALRLGLDARPA